MVCARCCQPDSVLFLVFPLALFFQSTAGTKRVFRFFMAEDADCFLNSIANGNSHNDADNDILNSQFVNFL